MNKFLLLIIALLFNATFIFSQTATAPALGSGTSGSPYQIATLENLYWIAASDAVVPSPSRAVRWAAYYIQTANIDASSTSTWFSGAGWPMIGYVNVEASTFVPFSGSYNGQGHTINGIFINLSTTEFVGLFRIIEDATLQNIGLTNLSVTAKDEVGGLIGGTQSNDIVDNCYATGSVTANDCQNGCGGLIGTTNDAIVSNCYSGCTVVGLTAGITNGNAGGLIGINYGTAQNCYSAGSVSGTSFVGGLLGASYDGSTDNGKVENCYSIASVSATNKVGGLIGVVGSCTITNCYSAGSVSGSTAVGGLVGYDESGSTASGCFWDTQTSGRGSSVFGTGKTTTQMKTTSTFTNAGWDFRGETTNGTNDYWDRADDKNNAYPYLSWQYPAAPEIAILGNGNNITDGQTATSTSDHTDFGAVNPSSGSQMYTFTINNTGTVTLNLSGGPLYVTLSGTGSGSFSVTTQPSGTIVASGSSTFQITFDPSTTGQKTATVSISSDDADESPFTFDITGLGEVPVVAPTTQATTITYSASDFTHVRVGWTRGNGANVAVFMAEATSGLAAPVDATSYTGSANWTSGSRGTQIGTTGWYCIYNGTGTYVDMSNLVAGTQYRIMACEYNGASAAELYLTSTASGNPANFTQQSVYINGATLYVEFFDGADFTIVADGTKQYSITSSNTGSFYISTSYPSINGGATGFVNTLTIDNSSSAFGTLNLTDGAVAGSSLAFGNSGSHTFGDKFNINLDNSPNDGSGNGIAINYDAVFEDSFTANVGSSYIYIASGANAEPRGTTNAFNISSPLIIEGGLRYNAVSGSQQISQQISGAGYVDVLGSGTLTLSGANTFSGGVKLFGGTLNIGSNGALGIGLVEAMDNVPIIAFTGSFTVPNNFSIESGIELTIQGGNYVPVFSGNIAVIGTLKCYKGTGAMTFSGILSSSGDIMLYPNTSGFYVINGSSSNTFDGMINVQGGSTLTLSKTGTNLATSGDITIATTGILKYGADNQTGSNNLLINNGSVRAYGTHTIECMTGNGILSNTGTSTIYLTVAGAGDYTYNGTISSANSFSLTIDNVSLNWTLGGSSTAWTIGTTTLTNGRLIASNNNSLGVSSTNFNFNGGTLKLINGTVISRGFTMSANAYVESEGGVNSISGSFIGSAGDCNGDLYAMVIDQQLVLSGNWNMSKTSQPSKRMILSGTGFLTLVPASQNQNILSITISSGLIVEACSVTSLASADVEVSDGGSILLRGASTPDYTNNFTLTGMGTPLIGAALLFYTSGSLSGTITLAGETKISVDNGGASGITGTLGNISSSGLPRYLHLYAGNNDVINQGSSTSISAGKLDLVTFGTSGQITLNNNNAISDLVEMSGHEFTLKNTLDISLNTLSVENATLTTSESVLQPGSTYQASNLLKVIDGNLNLSKNITATTLQIENGTLSGQGTLSNDLTLTGGTLSPNGSSVGTITVTRDINIDFNSRVNIDLDPSTGSSDRIICGRNLVLGNLSDINAILALTKVTDNTLPSASPFRFFRVTTAVTGIFEKINGTDLSEGYNDLAYTNDPMLMKITYVAGAGHDIGVSGSYPTTQASIITEFSKTTSSFTINWTSGNGEKRAVFVKEGTGAITNPSNNSTYTPSTDWSSKGTQLDISGYYCVYNGVGSSVTVTNLAKNQLYTIQIFEYNGSAGQQKYLTTTATGNPTTVTTDNPVITLTTTGFNGDFGNQMISTNSAERILTVAGTGLQGDITITAPTGFDISLMSGSGFASSKTISPTSKTVTTTNVYVRFSPTSVQTYGPVNVTFVATDATTQNLSVQGVGVNVPSLQAHDISATAQGSTTLTVTWTRGDGANCVAFMKAGVTTGSQACADGTSYTARANWSVKGTEIAPSTGWYCIYNGSDVTPNVNLTNLSAGEVYRIEVFEYNGGAGTEFYLTSGATNNPKTLNTKAIAVNLAKNYTGSEDPTYWGIRYFNDLATAISNSNAGSTITIKNQGAEGYTAASINTTNNTFIVDDGDLVLTSTTTPIVGSGLIQAIGDGYLVMSPQSATALTYPVTDGTHDYSVTVTSPTTPTSPIKVKIHDGANVNRALTVDLWDVQGDAALDATIKLKIPKASITSRYLPSNTLIRRKVGTDFVIVPRENVSITEFGDYYEVTIIHVNQF